MTMPNKRSTLNVHTQPEDCKCAYMLLLLSTTPLRAPTNPLLSITPTTHLSQFLFRVHAQSNINSAGRHLVSIKKSPRPSIHSRDTLEMDATQGPGLTCHALRICTVPQDKGHHTPGRARGHVPQRRISHGNSFCICPTNTKKDLPQASVLPVEQLIHPRPPKTTAMITFTNL